MQGTRLSGRVWCGKGDDSTYLDEERAHVWCHFGKYAGTEPRVSQPERSPFHDFGLQASVIRTRRDLFIIACLMPGEGPMNWFRASRLVSQRPSRTVRAEVVWVWVGEKGGLGNRLARSEAKPRSSLWGPWLVVDSVMGDRDCGQAERRRAAWFAWLSLRLSAARKRPCFLQVSPIGLAYCTD